MKTTLFYIITATIMALAIPLQAADVTVPNTFSGGTPAVASEVNANFTALQTGVNDNDTRLTATETNITNLETNKQNRVAAAGCASGSSIRVINSDGSVVCEVDTDTDTNTTYSNGFGLNLSGTTFSIDNNETQQRINASCAAGSSIRAIGSNGTVLCEIDTDTNSGGDITQVLPGAGLAGGGLTGSVTLKRANGFISVSNRGMHSTVTGNNLCVMDGSRIYSYISITSTGNNCKLSTGLNFPNGSTIIHMACKIYNNDGSTGNPVISLHRVATANFTDEVMATRSVGVSSSVQDVIVYTLANDTIYNNDYSYYLEFDPGDTTKVGNNHRFYTCEFSYAY